MINNREKNAANPIYFMFFGGLQPSLPRACCFMDPAQLGVLLRQRRGPYPDLPVRRLSLSDANQVLSFQASGRALTDAQAELPDDRRSKPTP